MAVEQLPPEITAEFYEEYPLYKRFRAEFLPQQLRHLTLPAIHMPCACRANAERTFKVANRFIADGSTGDDQYVLERAACVVFSCAACGAFMVFMLEFGPHEKAEMKNPKTGDAVTIERAAWVRKVGQWPQWNERIDKAVSKALGEAYKTLYQRGLACEGEGFGVGALAYYRRIVEDFVRAMIAAKETKLDGKERDGFKSEADKVRHEWSGKAAIDLVKDELPREARPDGHNPLTLLYGDLSEGLHTKTDEECAREAGGLRELLEELFLQIQRTKDTRTFADLVSKRHQKRSSLPGE